MPGLLFLFQEEEEIQRLLKIAKTKGFTSRTLTEKGMIVKDLEEVRRRGYAVDDQEYEDEIKSIGAPIQDRNGKVMASISLVGPVWLMSDEKMEKNLGLETREAARRISQKLGFMPDRKTYLY